MIEFKNVTKTYNSASRGKPVAALTDINLKIDDGETVFFVGPSGAGKTTMMRLLTRMEAPTSGSLKVNDTDLRRIRPRLIPEFRSQFGVEFQDCKLFPKFNVYENVAFAMRVLGTPNRIIKERVPKVLYAMNIQHRAKHFPDQLSGGEKQRAALARALVNNPRILIADEPTAGLDPRMSKDVLDLLVSLGESKKHKRTVIIITHEQALASQYGKRMVRFENGRIAEDTGRVEQ